MLPWPAWPIATVSTSTLWSNLDSALLTASVALHFLLVLTSIPAWETFWSWDSLYCTTCHAQFTLNSSVRLPIGSVSLLVLPYRVMLLKLIGSPNHLLRHLLILISTPSTVDSVNSYTSNGHRMLGRMLRLLLVSSPDWGRVFQNAVVYFPKALRLFCDGWDAGSSKRDTELVCHFPFLDYQRTGLCWLERHPGPRA